jgi:uncharacterized membrane protein
VPAAPARPAEVERNVGGRIFVWIGAIALFMAGAFFVKYTFERGLITPLLRVLIGGGFGVALLGVGEALRRSAATVAIGLTAAGVAILYAALLAATSLYHMLPQAVGFGLLAANTALAILLSLRHGPFVAGLGLVGGFATPALIGASEPNAPGLFGYLFALQVGLLVLGRARAWWPLSLLTLLGGFAWVAVWMLGGGPRSDAAWLSAFLLSSIFLFVTTFMGRAGDAASGRRERLLRGLGIAGAAVGAGLLGVVASYSGFQATDWMFIGLLCAGSILIARLRVMYAPLPFVTLLVSLVLLAAWHEHVTAPGDAVVRYVALALGTLFALGGYAALWGSPRPPVFAWLSSAGAAGFWTIAYLTTRAGESPTLIWPWQLLLLAAAYIVAAYPLYVARSSSPAMRHALAAICSGATFFLAVYVPERLRPEWVFAGWALQAAAIMTIAGRLRTPEIHPLAGALAVLATLCGLIPPPETWNVGTHPVFNWLLFGYGVSVAALAFGGWEGRQQGGRTAAVLEGATGVLAVFGALYMVRNAFSLQWAVDDSLRVHECAALVVAWLSLALTGVLVGRVFALRVYSFAGAAVWGLATAVLAWGVAVAALDWSWWWREITDTPVWNPLLFWLGVPALLQIAIGFALPEKFERQVREWAFGLAAILLALLVTAEVRHAFGRGLGLSVWLPARETATYVLAWLGLAAAATLWRWKRGEFAAKALSWGLRGLAAVACVLGLALLANPLVQPEPVGTRVAFNWLAYIYLAPAILLAVTAVRLGGAPVAIPRGLAAIALTMALLWTTTAVRQAYHGEVLTGPRPAGQELYAYSVAWGLLSLVLLGAGVGSRGVVLRWASLVVMLVTVCKVFLVDTAQLRDLYRVLSLLGLGLSLMAIGWAYQRIVFRAKPPAATPGGVG